MTQASKTVDKSHNFNSACATDSETVMRCSGLREKKCVFFTAREYFFVAEVRSSSVTSEIDWMERALTVR